MLPKFLTLFLIIFSLTHSEFLPLRLRIVDSNPERKIYFVRGNLPIDKDQKFQL